MTELKYLEGRVIDLAYHIMIDACRARLGHELLKLVESPQKETIRVSPRNNAGLGIDSDLPKPFLIPKDAGDYHEWSLFGLNDSYNHGIKAELIQRVVYLAPEEAIQTLEKVEATQENSMSRGIWFDTKPAYVLTQIHSSLQFFAGKDQKIQAKIQALFSDGAWRNYAKQFNAQLLTSARTCLERSAERILAESDDIIMGHRIVGTAQPVIDDLGKLLRMYAKEMEL